MAGSQWGSPREDNAPDEAADTRAGEGTEGSAPSVDDTPTDEFPTVPEEVDSDSPDDAGLWGFYAQAAADADDAGVAEEWPDGGDLDAYAANDAVSYGIADAAVAEHDGDEEDKSSRGLSAGTVVMVILIVALPAAAGWVAWDRWGPGGRGLAGPASEVPTTYVTVVEDPEEVAEPGAAEGEQGAAGEPEGAPAADAEVVEQPRQPLPAGALLVSEDEGAAVFRQGPTSEAFALAVYQGWQSMGRPGDPSPSTRTAR
ncbi:hypothetical protein [Corynebacterium otitidis]|uniref:Uncharacterized protein n=1 Tax=Corynebacterium otitidis ATCC 51513 TaxID=883169 RepID=I7IXX7_9CORY|nr:hypothetical protein [Corynebacterium otitidis]EJZ81527.1 hypothetical protein HMPREF9719_01570 [Corynebacterium otitidis ATCC 51513]CCI84133.1 hypothetical protein BN46_1421 [Corynebacterium otitidis ATCC 51513]